MTLLRLSAFTDGGRGGNPAGVHLAGAHPAAEEMQRVAAEVGCSETAFAAPAGDRRFDVRYFSPEAEVPFCGHATIATAVALAERDGPGPFTFATAAGEVAIATAHGDDSTVTATLTSVATQTRPLPDGFLAALLPLLGWQAADLDPALPPAFAYAGAWHLVLAVHDLATLAALDYDYEATKALMLEHGLSRCSWCTASRRTASAPATRSPPAASSRTRPPARRPPRSAATCASAAS